MILDFIFGFTVTYVVPCAILAVILLWWVKKDEPYTRVMLKLFAAELIVIVGFHTLNTLLNGLYPFFLIAAVIQLFVYTGTGIVVLLIKGV